MIAKHTISLAALLRHPAIGGIALMLAAGFSMLMANSTAAGVYTDIQHSLGHAVNDGLMVIFFFGIGLEIKRESVTGALSSRRDMVLPFMAALGGMIVPAAIYYAVNHDTPAHLSGWAIPTATDIAFALGVLSFLERRVPVSVKALLLAIAVIDDIGAIIIIAVFYTHTLSVPAIALSLAALCVFAGLRARRVQALLPYLAAGFVLYLAVLHSGVHATLAGVVAALFIPLRHAVRLEKILHPYIAFIVLPLFAFVNAGVNFTGLSPADLAAPVAGGIAAGLFIGKQAGVFAGVALAVSCGISRLPPQVNWGHIYGLSLLCGIGFTMSLFIGILSFDTPVLMAQTRVGVMAGSCLSAFSGYLFLRYCKGST